MKSRFKTPYNAEEFPDHGEVNNKPSLTIPDQSLSVKEIMERYARGLPLGGMRVPTYEEDPQIDDEYLPDPRTLDLAEREEIARYAKDEIKNIEERNKPKPKPKKKDDHQEENPA